ncbi:MAG: aminopeptidase P family protein [Crocinitomicaceae bacterium]
MTAKEKVAQLRVAMQEQNIEAFIVYSADPHMSEYLPEEWKERTWLSGFTGSAGFVVVTKNNAGLWTDGRYFTQAPIELAGSGIELFKDGMEGTPNYIDWIISETQEGSAVAVNALCTSNANWEMLHTKLAAANRQLKDLPLLKNIWTNRGVAEKNPIFVQPIARAGKSVEDKLADIRSKMKEMNASFHLLSSLDDIAWTLNLRGSDVECNPVFLSYLTISATSATLFVDTEKLNDEARQAMQQAKVNVVEYAQFFTALKEIKNERILIATNCNQSVFDALSANNSFIKAAAPGNLMKAQKNDTELNGFRSAMVKDGVAMVKFLYWLTHQAGKEAMTEYTIGQKLRGFRAEQKDFVGESFDSIVGYKGNGAIIHYKAPKEGCAEVTNDGSILVDSGGQYLEGTTDITRTFPLGAVSEEFKHDSTLVLKGHIQLSMVKFPKGTRGVQLDTLARMALWNEGKDYNHGTGHGVGCFMNVHEGPQNIRKDLNPQELLPGMVVSNEPGYYVENKYGIRHENLVVVKEWKKTEWNTFYEFETLTFCPFFKNSIIKELLTAEEIQWLNDYHRQCEEKIGPHLEGDVKNWFLDLVSPL